MTEKIRYKNDVNELVTTGIFDETTALGTNQKGKIVAASGDFIGLGWDEEDDILYAQSGVLPSNGAFGSPYNRYTQTYMSVTSKQLATKDGNQYAYMIYRQPNISSSSTWGGVSLNPLASLMRQSNHKFRFSFDYRGYSNGNGMEVYHNYTIGWGDLGIGLPTPWNASLGSFDTDWEWRHYNYEFTVTDTYLNWIGGNYDWDPNAQYGTGYYGIRYNGNIYRHQNGLAAPTLGLNPTQEPALYNGIYPATPGYFNLYNNIKIGFSYQAQGARGTHVHVDNIMLTDITANENFKYDLANGVWISETLTENGFDLLAKGTALVSQARADTGTDIFAIEGDRYVAVNGTSVGITNARGLNLVILNSSGGYVSNATYDVHAGGVNNTNLANALAAVTSDQYWVLTSWDAIGSVATHNANPALRDKLISMGSRMWNPDEGTNYLWYHNVNDVRNPYAAVGKGQKLIKEDGSGASDTVYKRKGVIQTRIS